MLRLAQDGNHMNRYEIVDDSFAVVYTPIMFTEIAQQEVGLLATNSIKKREKKL